MSESFQPNSDRKWNKINKRRLGEKVSVWGVLSNGLDLWDVDVKAQRANGTGQDNPPLSGPIPGSWGNLCSESCIEGEEGKTREWAC